MYVFKQLAVTYIDILYSLRRGKLYRIITVSITGMNQILALAESSLAALKAYRASQYKCDEYAVAALQSLKQIKSHTATVTTESAVETQALPMPSKPQVRRSQRLQQSRRASFTHK